jgi:hypothetical protein
MIVSSNTNFQDLSPQAASRESTIKNKTSSSPIFIFGSARSGTSLLSRIVGAHPRIAIPFESHLYNTFYPWLKYYGDLHIEKNRERLLDDILSTEVMRDWYPQPDRQHTLEAIEQFDFHGIVNSLMQEWTKAQGKQRWGEKTPWHIFYWREILDGFPKAKIIHIVRDGRDSSLSWKRARFGPKHIYPLAQRWSQYLSIVHELSTAVDAESFYEVRYEDLIADPERIAREICNFIGEEFSPEMLSFYSNNAPYPTDQQNQKNLTKPILPENTGKWRTAMTAREIRIFEAVAGSMLDRYGYERRAERPHISALEILQFKYIEHLPLKLLSMMKNRKGHIDGWRRLKIYLRLKLGL